MNSVALSCAWNLRRRAARRAFHSFGLHAGTPCHGDQYRGREGPDISAGDWEKNCAGIIIGVKDKLAKEQIPGGSVSLAGAESVLKAKLGRAAAALAVLGYSSAKRREALRGIDTEAQPLEDTIKMALKKMIKYSGLDDFPHRLGGTI